MEYKFPICDKCGLPIETFGRYINLNGKNIYVHWSYNVNTDKCDNNKIPLERKRRK